MHCGKQRLLRGWGAVRYMFELGCYYSKISGMSVNVILQKKTKRFRSTIIKLKKKQKEKPNPR